jgi:hypothetical protein
VPVTVTSNFVVGDVKFTTREIMREVGLLARETIRRRTARGVSADGSPFRPYSAGYTKQKHKQLGKADPVDLTVSGGMLNSLQIVEVTDTTVTLGFA